MLMRLRLLGDSGERSPILAYFLAVGSDTPTVLAIDVGSSGDRNAKPARYAADGTGGPWAPAQVPGRHDRPSRFYQLVQGAA